MSRIERTRSPAFELEDVEIRLNLRLRYLQPIPILADLQETSDDVALRIAIVARLLIGIVRCTVENEARRAFVDEMAGEALRSAYLLEPIADIVFVYQAAEPVIDDERQDPVGLATRQR